MNAFKNEKTPEGLEEETVRAAIDKVTKEGKPGALMTDEVFAAMARLRAGAPDRYADLRQEIKQLNKKDVSLTDFTAHVEAAAKGNGGAAAGDDKALGDRLVDVVLANVEPFVDQDGEPHITLCNSPCQTMLVKSQAARELISHMCYDRLERSASEAVVATVGLALCGHARHGGGGEIPVHLRVARAPGGNGYYIDLCDERWRAVHVYPGGWRVVDKPPVRFRRSQTMRPLPDPVGGGSLDLLWDLVNIPKNRRRITVTGMLETWRPETPFPVFEFIGPAGNGKSDTQERLRNAVDPNASPLRSAPKDVESLYVGANASWVQSYNNITHLSGPMQDALCVMATGGGYARRALYTDKDEVLVEAKRPVFINAVSPVVTAQDLIDRTVRIETPEMENRREAAELQAAYKRDHAKIFGALLDTFADALDVLPTVSVEHPPRMADFARLGTAVFKVLDAEPDEEEDFCEQYAAIRKQAVELGLDASPAALALIDLMATVKEYDGTVGQLHKTLVDGYKDRYSGTWPKSPQGLMAALGRQARALELFGISVAKDQVRKRDGFHVRVNRSKAADAES